LLGTLPDAQVGKRLNLSRYVVQYRRSQLGIEPWNAKKGDQAADGNVTGRYLHPWTAREDTLLGTMTDTELARQLGRPTGAVQRRRCLLSIEKWKAKKGGRSKRAMRKEK
jgi:hypothetical protein